MNIVAVLANGVGSRFNSNVPKQFHKVNGKMVIEYVIDSVRESALTDKIIIASNVAENSVYLSDMCNRYDIDLIDGGATRNGTLKNVLDYIAVSFGCEKLIVCDSVRPMITGELLDRYFGYLDENDAVVTAQKITDSLGSYDFQKVDRERYYLMQSPEGFAFPLLYKSFDAASPLTEVTQQLPPGSSIKLYFDFTNNFKLTYPADLKYLEALIKDRDNEVDVRELLSGVTRLNALLEKHYPSETRQWLITLNSGMLSLFKKWQIESYELIQTSHFGIIFIADSIKYGRCVLKIIPPFIDRYSSERSCYKKINSSYMCELYDYDDECSAILLECCEDADASFDSGDKEKIFDFFSKVMTGQSPAGNGADFKDYGAILRGKLSENDFSYKNELIMSYVSKAVDVYGCVFAERETALIHGDLHRYNIMSRTSQLTAIDPIGYNAPPEFDLARYIGTELTDGECSAESLDAMLDFFSELADRETLKAALFVDVVFRLHNSLFENENYTLTEKWLGVLEIINKIYL